MFICIDNFEWRPKLRALFSKTVIADIPFDGFTIIGKTRSVRFDRVVSDNDDANRIVDEAMRMGIRGIFVFYNDHEDLFAVICQRRIES